MGHKKNLVSSQTQAMWFKNVRNARQNELTEDYVELIADLIDALGEARLVEIAARMGVAHPTASKVIQRLKEEGYVSNQPYRAIFLTEKGWHLAKKSRKRHQIILDFLIQLGVDKQVAAYDAEGIEHHISQETLDIFEKMTKNNSKIKKNIDLL